MRVPQPLQSASQLQSARYRSSNGRSSSRKIKSLCFLSSTLIHTRQIHNSNSPPPQLLSWIPKLWTLKVLLRRLAHRQLFRASTVITRSSTRTTVAAKAKTPRNPLLQQQVLF